MHSHLSSVAMLADFSASEWTARKIDKAASAKVTEEANAHSRSAHVSKKLVASSALSDIHNLVMQTRIAHNRLTSPWYANGAGILHIHNHDEYVDVMEKGESKFHPLVAQFVADYPMIRERAREQYTALGKLWNASDYPAVERIASKFAWRSSIFAIPDAADFRANIDPTYVARIRADIEATMNNRTSAATIDCFERSHKAIAEFVEKLDAFKPDKSGADRGTFRDTVNDGLADLVAIMPGLNLAGDQRVSQLIADMAALAKHEPETLRVDDIARRETIARAKDIVSAVSDFMA